MLHKIGIMTELKKKKKKKKNINNNNKIIYNFITYRFEVLFLGHVSLVFSFTNFAVVMIMIVTITMIINENIQPAAMVLINVRRLFLLEVSEKIIIIININFILIYSLDKT